MDRPEGRQEWWLHPAVLSAIFVIGLSPFILDHLLFHPDERHYVEAGIQMVQTGDWLTPRTAEGELRFKKPIVPYWFVAAACAVFGPSPFSTRLLFLLAGGGMVWLSWYAAWLATESRRAATLVALIVMCHPALIISAPRSIPDVVLGLFLLVSMAGFLGIVAREQASYRHLACAFVGGGLAILSKGAPAVVFVGYATLFLLVRQRTLLFAHWKRFTLFGVACVVISSSWFLTMQWLHGEVLTDQFVGDQTGSQRFAKELSQIAWQVILFAGILAASFIGILSVSTQTLWRQRRNIPPVLARPVNQFLLGWSLLFAIAAVCLSNVTMRYLLPIVPAVTIVLGGVLAELEAESLRRNAARLGEFVSLLLFPGTAAVFYALHGDQWPMATVVVCVGLAILAVLMWNQLRCMNSLRSFTLAATGLHMVLFVIASAGVGVLAPSFGFQMSTLLHEEAAATDTSPSLVLYGEPMHAARIRVCSGGTVSVVLRRKRDDQTPLPPDWPIAAYDESLLPAPGSGIRHVRVPFGILPIAPRELLNAAVSGRLAQLFRDRQEPCFVALPTRTITHNESRQARRTLTPDMQ